MRYVWELTADWKWRWEKNKLFSNAHTVKIFNLPRREVSMYRLRDFWRRFSNLRVSIHQQKFDMFIGSSKERKKFLLSTVIFLSSWRRVLVNQQENEKRKLPILGLQSEWTGMHSMEIYNSFFSRLLSSLYRIAACNLNFSARELDNIQISSLEKERSSELHRMNREKSSSQHLIIFWWERHCCVVNVPLPHRVCDS